MSETTIDPAQTVADDPVTPAADEQKSPVEPAAEKGPDLAAEVAKWKELSRKNEQRAKENADKAKKLDEIEEANKTELEKLLDRAEKAETALTKAKADAMRATKAAESGVPVGLIYGNTEEEMDAAVQAAKAWVDSQAKPPLAPPADLVTSNGSAPKADQIRSRDELKSMTPQEIIAAKKDGRMDELLGKTP